MNSELERLVETQESDFIPNIQTITHLMDEIISDKRIKFFKDRILMENYFEGK